MKWGKTLETQWVPFDKDGNQNTYSSFGDPSHEPTPEEQAGIDHGWGISEKWRPNEVFTDTLQYVSYSRGRSSAMFVFKRLSTRTEVSMFMTDIDEIVPLMSGGMLGGVFTFCKRGANYGVKLLPSVMPSV